MQEIKENNCVLFAVGNNNEQETKTLKRLDFEGKEIILLGTAHISEKSIQEVKEVILKEMPETVCVELDEARYQTLTNPDKWKDIDIVKLIKEGKGFLLLVNLSLQAFQKKLGLDLGVKPGDEMKAAIDSANKLNLKVALVDRQIQITLKRAWRRSSFLGKSRLLSTLLAGTLTQEKLSSEEIEKLKQQSAMDGIMDEVSQYLPSVKKVIIDERDQYLASKIWQCKAKKMVAVLGAGHLPGVERWLKEFSENRKDANCTDELDIVPKKNWLSIFFSFLFPSIILGLIVAGFVKGGFETTKTQLISYTLWNGGLASLGALLAFANPITILVAFIVAPLTSINPFIGVGFFTGVL